MTKRQRLTKLVVLTFPLIAMACSNESVPRHHDANAFPKRPERQATSLVGASSVSELWTCHAVTVFRGPALTRKRMALLFKRSGSPGTEVPIPDDQKLVTKRRLGVEWQSQPNEAFHSSDYSIGGTSTAAVPLPGSMKGSIFKRSQTRFYTGPPSRAINLIIRELGEPAALLRTSGEGCRLGRFALLYVADSADADGTRIQVGEMCQAPPVCALERSDPCADPGRLPIGRYILVSIDRAILNSDLEKAHANRRSNVRNLTRVSIRMFNPKIAGGAGYPLAFGKTARVCEAEGNTLLN